MVKKYGEPKAIQFGQLRKTWLLHVSLALGLAMHAPPVATGLGNDGLVKLLLFLAQQLIYSISFMY